MRLNLSRDTFPALTTNPAVDLCLEWDSHLCGKRQLSVPDDVKQRILKSLSASVEIHSGSCQPFADCGANELRRCLVAVDKFRMDIPVHWVLFAQVLGQANKYLTKIRVIGVSGDTQTATDIQTCGEVGQILS